MNSIINKIILLSALALTACSDDNFVGDPVKERFDFLDAKEEAGFSTYYTPTIGRVGDPMPFFDKKSNTFKVMYLQEYDNNRPYRFHPIWAVETADGANYKDLGEWIPTGGTDKEQDAAPGTGCCYYNEADGLYYVYYTGHNGQLANVEAVLRATSPDLKTWTKDNLWALYGKDFEYSAVDFRDPQIFEEGGKYHMIIATKPIWGGDPCFAEFVSTDLKNWEKGERIKMIWDRFLECPDIFEMGGKWYCVYSESFKAVWSRKVKYMMGDSWEDLKRKFNDGPQWPEFAREGVLDTRAFYAGKTASNGTDRYIWGWCPYRENEDNAAVGAGDEPKWSGALVCHQVKQNPDGTLYLAPVPAMAEKYNKTAEVKVVKTEDNYTMYDRLGYHNHISFTVKTAGTYDKFGVSFARVNGNPWGVSLKFNNPHWDAGWNEDKKDLARIEYCIEEPHVYQNEKGEWVTDVASVFIDGAEGNFYPRPADNTWNIDIYTDNSVVVVYVNGTSCFTSRIYGLTKNCWSINTYEGSISVENLSIKQY